MLYGEEGSREGGAVGGRRGRGSKGDREFDRLVALADPEMGDGAADGADGKVNKVKYLRAYVGVHSTADIIVLYFAACRLTHAPDE